MASPEQIAELRRLINELDESVYTDLALSALIDADGELTTLAGSIWREKAASYVGLIDVREGNSDRKLSQLHAQALRMAEHFSLGSDGVVDVVRRPSRTRQIERQ